MSIDVVIPIFNMKNFVTQVAEGLRVSGVLQIARRVIFVDDGSNDGTGDEVMRLGEQDEKINLLRLPENQGRFIARLKGAQHASAEELLFVDARVSLPEHFGEELKKLLAQGTFIQPQARIDVRRNIFCLYWERSHERLFARHYQAMEKGSLWLNLENYDDYLKGTTVLVTPRQLFIDCCLQFQNTQVLSDDTLVMKKMVVHQPLLLAPSLWFWWVPRENWLGFVGRLLDRGPGLIEYHVFVRRGWIFMAIVLGLLFLILLAGLLVLDWQLGLGLISVAIIGALVSTAFFAKSVTEFFRLAPLHLLSILAFGGGVLWGLFYNSRRWLKGELRL